MDSKEFESEVFAADAVAVSAVVAAVAVAAVVFVFVCHRRALRPIGDAVPGAEKRQMDYCVPGGKHRIKSSWQARP